MPNIHLLFLTGGWTGTLGRLFMLLQTSNALTKRKLLPSHGQLMNTIIQNTPSDKLRFCPASVATNTAVVHVTVSLQVVAMLKLLVFGFTFLVAITTFATCQPQQCMYGARYCKCNETYDVCEFKLVIEHFQTFAGYRLDAATSIRGTQGQVFYLGPGGKLVPVLQNGSCTEFGAECTEPSTVDGSTYRTFIGVNGSIPGPTLIVREDQIVIVEVQNNLTTEGTSIHWHGMHQRNTPWMDGVGMISQCPIQPGTTFRYIFRAFPSGTFWYHSHSGAQRTDGLYGGLIVMEKNLTYPEEFIDLPEEHTLLLMDWQREASIDLFTQIHSGLRFFQNKEVDRVPMDASQLIAPTVSPDNVEVGPVPFWSGIINRRGKHVDVVDSLLEVFEVERGGMYRFRIVGAQGLYAYMFSIDGHRMKLIATDGYLIQPIDVDYIIVHTGERYDFLLTANQTTTWIRAQTLEIDTSKNFPKYDFLDHSALAILHYASTPEPVAPYANVPAIPRTCDASTPCIAVNCPFENFHESYYIDCINVHELRLFSPTPESELPSAEPDEEIFFNFGFDQSDLTSTINGRNFVTPPSPLGQLEDKSFCDLTDDCENGCKCIHVQDIPYGKTIRFVLSAIGNPIRRNFSHPVHLHGHSFHVLYTGYGTYDDTNGYLMNSTDDLVCKTLNTTLCTKPGWTNGSAPNVTIDRYTIRKDTVIVPAGGYVIIHFISDNPGYWFFHCHIESHQLEGMALVINEAEDDQNPPPDGFDRCGNFNWTVKDFERKEEFNPFDRENNSSSKEKCISNDLFNAMIALIVIFFVIILILITVIVLLCCKYCNCCEEPYEKL